MRRAWSCQKDWSANGSRGAADDNAAVSAKVRARRVVGIGFGAVPLFPALLPESRELQQIIFASVMALVLGLIGIYGVVTHVVSQLQSVSHEHQTQLRLLCAQRQPVADLLPHESRQGGSRAKAECGAKA